MRSKKSRRSEWLTKAVAMVADLDLFHGDIDTLRGMIETEIGPAPTVGGYAALARCLLSDGILEPTGKFRPSQRPESKSRHVALYRKVGARQEKPHEHEPMLIFSRRKGEWMAEFEKFERTTRHIREAKRYGFEEAIQFCQENNGEWIGIDLPNYVAVPERALTKVAAAPTIRIYRRKEYELAE